MEDERPCGYDRWGYPAAAPANADLGPQDRTFQRAVQRGQIRGGAVRSPFLDLAESAVLHRF
jgi:hypothetical protein